jgi:hypothetical protein
MSVAGRSMVFAVAFMSRSFANRTGRRHPISVYPSTGSATTS